MYKKIRNVIKGNLYYWNTIHKEKAVSYVYEQFIDLNNNEKEIANCALAYSSLLISTFIGFERKKLTSKIITDKAMKTVTAKEHIEILLLCFEMFSKILGFNDSRNILTETDKKVFGNEYLIDTDENKLEEKSIKNLVLIYAQAIAEKSKIINKSDPVYIFSFFSLTSDFMEKIVEQANYIQKSLTTYSSSVSSSSCGS